ncbi:MAG: hypothetical protein KGS72_00330 [Cyanobacteria bacterium REEB67]|nr:hypothetical protein [Cyanobacteria bacterium REEB67]
MSLKTSRLSPRIWRLLGIFILALIVRLVYNIYIAQHRIIDVGDSFYYLSAGRSLARLVRESQSIQAFFGQLCAAAQYAPGSLNSFSSLALSDRLLIDGPIYPSYLAAVFLVTGKALSTAALNVHQLTFALANSLLDACLAAAVAYLGEISFGLASGLLAGIFWCFYLPAVINTQQCYGEPVVALLLTLFVVALFRLTRGRLTHDDTAQFADTVATARSKSFLFSLIGGVLAGLVMLAKPAFVVLPPLLLALHFIALAFSGRLRRKRLSLASMFLGVILALAPWLLYTSTVTGAPRLIVNRAPGYNLYIGNYLPTDGWKTWPVVDGIPDSVADAKRFIVSEFDRRPLELVSLTLRKIPRLFAGVWNDFHLSAFAVSYNLQNLFQALYLLLATLALMIFTAGKLRGVKPFSYSAALTMTWAVAFHFIYVLFEPVPRYAFTAMPLVLTLAAAGLVAFARALAAVPSKKLRQRTAWQYLFLILLFAVFSSALYCFWTPVGLFVLLVKNATQLRSLSALLVFTIFICLGFGFGRLFKRTNLGGFLCYWIGAKTFLLTALVAVCAALSEPAYLEWSHKLGGATTATVTTHLALPDLGGSEPATVFLLVDAQGEDGPPALAFTLPDRQRVSPAPISLYEVTAASKDIPTLLNLQGRMMDRDQRSFRQWWLFPIRAKSLHFGGDNLITVMAAQPKAKVKIFGDYVKPSPESGACESADLPSLTSFSWSKGFLTADCRDPRVYENCYFRGRATAAYLNAERSTEPTAGALRLRVAVPMLGRAVTAANLTGQNLVLFDAPAERLVSGAVPYSLLFASPVKVFSTPVASASRLHFRAKLRTIHPDVPASIAISLDVGKARTQYNPVWLPSCIKLEKEWREVDFTTVLPADTKYWSELSAHLLLSPYQSDRFYLHGKETLRDAIYVKDLRLEILPPLNPGGRPSGVLKLL